MKRTDCAVQGAYVLELEAHADERGQFARTFCKEEFSAWGMTAEIAQCSYSQNTQRGTLRGMHFQAAPQAETKLVRCTRGALFDVVLDLRRESPSYLRWFGLELTPSNLRSLYIPEGCAHGFLTLADDTEVFYQISAAYVPELARGVRYNDPAFGIQWPAEVRVVSERDRAFVDFKP